MNALLWTPNASRSRTRSVPDADGAGGAWTFTAVGLELGLAEADAFALADVAVPAVLEPLPPAEHPAISKAAPLTRAAANSGRTAA
ncbi:MAG TPA: hypothetical protein VMC83_18440 [Streptosporangiaceae bacterium]|nr:hypothetical protein [Streptosporangiaceae bacterium]